MLARRSRATIVTNERFARRIRSGGARAIVVRDVPTTFPPGTGRQVAGTDFPVAVVSSGAPDEPLVAIAAAAERVPGATFFVTGDVRRVRERLGGDPPPNVRLTGFLPEADYYGLLRSAVAVVCLTTRDDTMQRGACEALSVGTPIVTSDRPLLREYFRLGTVHVSNTAESIADGVAEIMRDSGRYRSEIRRLARQRRAEWLDTLADLRDETGLPHASGGDRLRRSSRSPSASRA
jgi:hypothetical protein